MPLPSNYRLRPSAAAVWGVCAGHVTLSEGQDAFYADDEDTTVREEGTACHWLAHSIGTGQPVATGTLAPNGVPLTDEMQDGAALYLQHLATWPVRALMEQPVHCRLIHEECGGVTDAGGFDRPTMTVYVADFKFGYRFVEIVNNPQLVCYFTGVCNAFGVRPEEVNFHFSIVQPRSFGKVEAVRTWKGRGVDLLPEIARLQRAAIATLSPNPPCVLNVGCGNCAGRHRCATFMQAAGRVVDDSHAATPHDLPFEAAEAELRMLQWSARILEGRITGLEQQVLHGIRRGALSKHYGLQPTVGKLAWKDGVLPIVQNIATLYRVNLNKPEALITPTQAKDKLPAHIVDMYSHRPKGGLKLAPADEHLKSAIFGKK